MKVIIENMFFGWHENAPETFIKLINSLVVAKDETEIRNVMQHFAQSSIFNTIWKSHSTLPLLATQNYPFWLKYD